MLRESSQINEEISQKTNKQKTIKLYHLFRKYSSKELRHTWR